MLFLAVCLEVNVNCCTYAAALSLFFQFYDNLSPSLCLYLKNCVVSCGSILQLSSYGTVERASLASKLNQTAELLVLSKFLRDGRFRADICFTINICWLCQSAAKRLGC